jgi:uncharacterized protein YwqG
MEESESFALNFAASMLANMFEHSVAQPTRPDKESLKSAFVEAGLGEYWESWVQVLRPAIYFHQGNLSDDSKIPIGASKSWGIPGLPPDIKIPVDSEGNPCSFIAQINLADVAELDWDSLLPKTGLLSFFSSDQGCGWRQMNGDPVFYFPRIDNLQRNQEYEYLVEFSQQAQTLRSFGGWSAPTNDNLPDSELEFIKDYDLLSEYEDFCDDNSGTLNLNLFRKHMFGHSDNHHGTIEPDCELIRRGFLENNNSDSTISTEEYQALRQPIARQSFRDWVCLFKDNDSSPVFTFSYMIHREDLDKQDFSKVICFGV